MTDTIITKNIHFPSELPCILPLFLYFHGVYRCSSFETWWHTVTHGRGSEGETDEWKWVASTLTLPQNVVYPALLTLTRTPQLPAVDWTDSHADLNGLVRFGERRNLVSARVPSSFKRALQLHFLKKEQWNSEYEAFHQC